MTLHSSVNGTLFWRPSERRLKLQRRYNFAQRFRLLEEMGAGGFGQVWRVTDTLLDQEVALKIGQGDMSQETLALRRLRKDRYISVYDYVYDGGFDASAYSMELLKHPWYTLEDYHHTFIAPNLADDSKILHGIRLIMFIIVDVLTSLAQPHGKKHSKGNRWVHGDIKPQNIYVNHGAAKLAMKQTPDNFVAFTKIGDLGLVHRAGEMCSGFTFGYCSPEQASPTNEGISCSSDLYSVGQTLSFLLVGRVLDDEELRNAARIKSVILDTVRSGYLAASLARFVKELTSKAPSLRGSAEDAKRGLVNAFLPDRDLAILSVFLVEASRQLTLNEAADRGFDAIKALKGWNNRSGERIGIVKQLIKGLKTKGVLASASGLYRMT